MNFYLIQVPMELGGGKKWTRCVETKVPHLDLHFVLVRKSYKSSSLSLSFVQRIKIQATTDKTLIKGKKI